MFCTKCGSNVTVDARFCRKCGAAILLDRKIDSNSNTSDKLGSSVEKSRSSLVRIVGAVSFILAFVVGKYLGLVAFLFFGAFWVGQWFPAWYLKKHNENDSLVKWTARSNFLAWLLPPFGLMTGVAAYEFGDRFGDSKYKILGIIGVILSLINATIGYLINM